MIKYLMYGGGEMGVDAMNDQISNVWWRSDVRGCHE